MAETVHKTPSKVSSGIQDFNVVSHEEWIKARKDLLVKEKEFTRLRDQLSHLRRPLPWEKAEKEYVFEGPDSVAAEPLIKEIYIDAPPQVVFTFLTDPVKMIRWMGIRSELDPKPGGIYRLDPNGRDVIRGTYLEVVPNSRLVFTWGWEETGHDVPAGSTVVEIVLEPRDTGTWVRLTHRELPPEAREKHELGWMHYLARLQMISEGREPGPDPFADSSVRHG